MAAKGKVFMNGRSQAVRLPAEFRFQGREVDVRRDPRTGDVILSEPKPEKSWDEFFRLVDQLQPEDIPEGFPWRDTRPHERDDPLS